MPLNRNMTFVPETFTIHFRDGDGNVVREETMPLGETVEFHAQDELIHREDAPYIRFNPHTEATFTATNAVFNAETLNQLVEDERRRYLRREYDERLDQMYTQIFNAARFDFDDTDVNEPEKELADVDPDEFDKILSA